MSDEVEIWKAVPGYEGVYEASTLGRVRSLDRVVNVPRTHTSSYKKPVKGAEKSAYLSHGYQTLKMKTNGKTKTLAVHSVIAMTFLGERPSGYQVNHKDMNKKNNRPSNLEYVTPSENIRHSLRNGHGAVGERHHCATIKRNNAIKILEMMTCGMSQKEVAEMTGYSINAVHSLFNGDTWKSIDRYFPWQHAAYTFNVRAAGVKQ